MQYCPASVHPNRCCKFVVWPRMTWGTPGSLEMVTTPSPDFPCSSLSLPWEKQPTKGSVGIGHVIIAKGARPIFFKQEERTAHRCSYDTTRVGKKSGSYRKHWNRIRVDREGSWRAAVEKWGSTREAGDNECASGKWCLLQQRHSILLHKFRTTRGICWQACIQTRQEEIKIQPTNKTHNVIFYYNLIYSMVWLMIFESSGFAAPLHFSVRSSSTFPT